MRPHQRLVRTPLCAPPLRAFFHATVKNSQGNRLAVLVDCTDTGDVGQAGFEAAVAETLVIVTAHTGYDLTPYKSSLIRGAMLRRMQACGVSRASDYVIELDRRRDEAVSLLSEVWVGVTSFFREARGLNALTQYIAALAAGRRPIRVWVAGCASGQEAYSLAILVAETLRANDVAMLATDIDGGAIACARMGQYDSHIARDVTPERLSKNFARDGRGYRVHHALRDRVDFSVHDLFTDPPGPDWDVISCRNVLIYLEPCAQLRLLSTFHHALVQGGALLLGLSENVGTTSTGRFESIDYACKLFRKRCR